jgi:hypothetical protein
MLADRELATIRAALAYWRDEMTPHGREAMQPYLDVPLKTPLAPAEIERLRSRFLSSAVRYALFVDTAALRLVSERDALAAAQAGAVVLTAIDDIT